ncbi:MAG: hypothetical protein EOP51_15300 [Sphingobacteriales bacterium]|nr:MAG: hypothetical protein EOP51_15300 [Sphingobacteriales bacterium]
MKDNYVSLMVDVDGQSLKGFCLRITDEFYETYAVILDGCQSFSIWLDDTKKSWQASKYANVSPQLMERIIQNLSTNLQVS